jgi:hypothetical protein
MLEYSGCQRKFDLATHLPEFPISPATAQFWEFASSITC